MAKIVQFQRVDATMYWLDDGGNIYRYAPKHPFKVEKFDPKMGKWK